MSTTQPVLLASRPGIKRDGTRFEGDHYIDGQWCRFQRGKPRKIGGYQAVTNAVPEIARGMNSFTQDGINYVHVGHPNSIGQYQINNSGNLNGFTERTPSGFLANIDNLWQLTTFFDVVGQTNQLVAHAGQNSADIASSVRTPIYIGDVTDTAILSTTGIGMADVSGGVVAVGVYLFSYGSDGEITFSAPNNFAGPGTTQNVTPQKVVFGIPLRGAGTGPAALFWSLDSLVRATFNQAGPQDFAFDTIATDTSILSSQSVVEYDGVYYWPGVDRWQMFNGVVREIPNNLNQNWFFDNLNFAQRQKVFGMKVPRFGEIWWCYPRGGATECTHAVIFNVREGYWYDTALPDTDGADQGRTAGVFAKVYNKPFMVDNSVGENGRTLWQHETSNDKIEQTSINPIPSHFELHERTMQESQVDKSVRVARIEPDFVQSGEMTLTVRGRANSKAPQVTLDPQSFPDVPDESTEETIKLKDVQRLMSFRFDSNIQGGDYEYGDTYAHIGPADGRVES